MIRKYRIIKTGHLGQGVGTICFSLVGHDFGLASDDTRFFGKEFVSVTLQPNGGYPSFTIEKAHLEEQPYPKDEQPPGDPKRCGMGEEEKCCIWLTVGSGGFNCERNTGLHEVLVGKRKDMVAQRMPDAPWPQCQDH